MDSDLFERYPSLKKFEDDDYPECDDGREEALLEYIKNRSDYSDIKGNPPKLLEAMDEFSTQQDFLISIGSDKARILAEMVAAEKPKILVELGGYVGYSAIWFAHLMRQVVGESSSIKIWSLEYSEKFAKVEEEFIEIAGLSDYITVVVGSADDSLRKLHSESKLDRVDFWFLDHPEESYEPDLKVCEELGILKQGSIIVADNVVRPGAPAYRSYVRSQPKYKSEGIKSLIMPGEAEDELEVSRVL